jgi:phage-related protein
MSSQPDGKPLFWVGSSLKDLRGFPEEVKDEIGFALYQAQRGLTPRSAKPLKGFTGASVLEISDDFQTDTYRAVYTVQFTGAVYVLHAFQKKSKRGVEMPKGEIELVKARLKLAKEHHQEWRRNREEKDE